jgi:hypothetical protein
MELGERWPRRPNLPTRVEKTSILLWRKKAWAPFPFPPGKTLADIVCCPNFCKRACQPKASAIAPERVRCEGASNFPVHGAINCRVCLPMTWTRTAKFCICLLHSLMFPVLDASGSSPLPWARQTHSRGTLVLRAAPPNGYCPPSAIRM